LHKPDSGKSIAGQPSEELAQREAAQASEALSENSALAYQAEFENPAQAPGHRAETENPDPARQAGFENPAAEPAYQAMVVNSVVALANPA